MPKLSFILGVALLVVASTLAITITSRQTTSEVPQSKPAPRIAGEEAREVFSQGPRGPNRQPRKAYAFTVTAPTTHPNYQFLSEQAALVEQEARFHLERMSEKLELSPRQQERLFPILARIAEDYQPEFIISGIDTGARALGETEGEEKIQRVLDTAQQEDLIERAVADQLLWQEIINKLKNDLDEGTPQVKSEDGEAGRAPSEASERRRDNLFEVIEP